MRIKSFSDKVWEVLILTIGVFMTSILIYIIGFSVVKATETVEAKANEVTEDDYVYIICDVAGFSYDDKGTAIDCILPNGEIHTYYAVDTPLEMELVCLRTDDQDDYTSYKIVAIR